MGSTKRTTIRLTEEREQLLARAKAIIAAGPTDDPPNSKVIDAALIHLIESEQNLDDAMATMDPTTVEQFNTSVIGVQHRSTIESNWR